MAVSVALPALCAAGPAMDLDDCIGGIADKQMIATALGQDEDVVALSRQGLKSCGEHPVLYMNMAMPLRALGRDQDAEKALARCLELDPRHVACMRNLGNLYSDQGRYTDAMLQYKGMLEIDPEDDDAFDNMAVVWLRKGEIEESIRSARQAVAVRPSNIHARITLAKGYLAAERWREAIDAIDDAQHANPGYPGLEEASNHVRLTAREPVIREARRQKGDAWAQYYHARVAESDKEGSRAIRDALKLDSRQPRLLLEYAYQLDPDEAQEFFETLDKCLEIDPNFWPCLILKADELRYAKRDSEARNAFERGQRIAPWVPTFYWDLGLLLAQRGDPTSALVQLERGFELGEDPSFRRLAALLYTKQGSPDRAKWHATSGAMAGDAECRRMVEALQKGGQ